MSELNNGSALTVQFFFESLKERVSSHNARLILNSALLETGLKDTESSLNTDEAKNLCLYLINKGGPAFSIGQSIYRQHLSS